MHFSPRLLRHLCADTALLLTFLGTARAQNQFNQSFDNDWLNAANWSLASVPAASDDVWVGYGVDALIGAAASARIVQLYQGSSITVNEGGFSASQLLVGVFGDLSRFIVQNGAQTTVSDIVYVGIGGTGELVVSGTGSTLSIGANNEMIVGSTGSGSVEITDGGRISVDFMRVGMSTDDHGSIRVSGVDSMLTINGSISLGYGGQGVLTVENGATGSSGEMTFNYFQPGATGIMTVTGAGSEWTATSYVSVLEGSLTIAEGGKFNVTSGSLLIEDGATLHLGLGGLGGTLSTPYLSIAGSLIADSTDHQIITAPIDRSGAIVQKGTGTLTLAGNNSGFDGTIRVEQGTLRGTATDAFGAASITFAGGNLVLAGNTARNSTGAAITVSADATFTSDRSSAGAGVTHTLGTLGLGGSSLTLARGANVASGTAGLTLGATTLTANGARFHTDTGTLLTLGSLGGLFGFEKSGAGQLTLGTASTRNTSAGSTTLTAGTLRLTTANALNTSAAAPLFLNGGTLQLANNTGTTFNGTAITLGGDATVSLNRTSSGSGVTHTVGALTLGGHTLTVARGSGFNSNQTGSLTFGATTLTGDATLDLAHANGTARGTTTLGALNDNGTARTLTKKGASTLTLASAATSLVGGTAFKLDEGRVNLNHATALGSLASVTLRAGSTLALGASPTLGALNGNGTVALDGNTLTIGAAANNLSSSFDGVLSGTNGKITKAGDGALTLSGANTYTGATAVDAGKLFVNGSLATGAVTVSSGATLGGSGTFGGLTTLSSGAFLTPGAGIGTITFTNGLRLNAGSVLDFDMGATSDSIRVSGGTLTGPGAGTITVNLIDAGGFAAGVYTLIDASGAATASIGATAFQIGSGIAGYTYAFSRSGDLFQLTVTAIPEPATTTLLGAFSVLALTALRRRRR